MTPILYAVAGFVVGFPVGALTLHLLVRANYRRALDVVYDKREALEDRLCELEAVR